MSFSVLIRHFLKAAPRCGMDTIQAISYHNSKGPVSIGLLALKSGAITRAIE